MRKFKRQDAKNAKTIFFLLKIPARLATCRFLIFAL
jgi:hypothetical protein